MDLLGMFGALGKLDLTQMEKLGHEGAETLGQLREFIARQEEREIRKLELLDKIFREVAYMNREKTA